MKNKKYADVCELNDYLMLKDFNKKLNIEELGQTPYMHTTDASGYTKQKEYVNIELKRRFTSVETYPSLMIEGHKLLSLLMGFMYEKQIPLYINFMDDAVVVFNLARLKTKPQLIEKKIKSHLYNAYDVAERYELQLSDAWIYSNDTYALLHKPY